MNTNINATNLTLRNKFVKLIESDDARQAYTNACKKFCGLTEDVTEDILWRLTYYNPDDSSKDLQRLGLNPEEIPAEILTALRNELRSQYKQHHPDAWKVDVPKTCMEAFTDLKNHTDEIVATKVLNHCFSRVTTSEEDMERVLFLLKSDIEKWYFGGLRELKFNSEQASYLKPYHMEIHNLFVAVCEQFKQQCRSGDSFTNKPFAGLSDRLNEAGVNVSDDELPYNFSDPVSDTDADEDVQPESHVEEPAEVSAQPVITEFTALTADNIMANKDVFFAFAVDENFSSLPQIKALGFDLNAVIDRKNAILYLLSAEAALYEAQQNRNKAAEALSN